jgi:hypothetical protein
MTSTHKCDYEQVREDSQLLYKDLADQRPASSHWRSSRDQLARRKLHKFDKLWADCSQEESRLMSKKQKVNDEENQALATQVKKRKKREEGSPKKSKRSRYKKDAANIRCYSFQNLGHYAFQCPDRNEKEKKKNHAHVADAEEQSKASKDEEFVF